jgi:hypothetical protein
MLTSISQVGLSSELVIKHANQFWQVDLPFKLCTTSHDPLTLVVQGYLINPPLTVYNPELASSFTHLNQGEFIMKLNKLVILLTHSPSTRVLLFPVPTDHCLSKKFSCDLPRDSRVLIGSRIVCTRTSCPRIRVRQMALSYCKANRLSNSQYRYKTSPPVNILPRL